MCFDSAQLIEAEAYRVVTKHQIPHIVPISQTRSYQNFTRKRIIDHAYLTSMEERPSNSIFYHSKKPVIDLNSLLSHPDI